MEIESDKLKLAQEFSTITNCSMEESVNYIEAANFELDRALDLFYDSRYPVKTKNYRKIHSINPYEEEPEIRPKIRTMKDLQANDDNVDKIQEFYAGGSGARGGSSTNVLGPNKKLDGNVIINRAKESGATLTDAETFSNIQKSTFSRKGYRLDGEETAESQTPDLILVELYSNGFLVNNEHFFDSQQPETRQYIEYIIHGSLPESIFKKLKCKSTKTPIMRIHDNSQEMYIPPKTAKPFSSRGVMLGSPVPTIVSSSIPTGSSRIIVNPETSSIQLTYKLYDGSRHTVTVNPSSHTARDLYNHIRSQTPANQSFSLILFPHETINENDVKIDQLKIERCLILQKYC